MAAHQTPVESARSSQGDVLPGIISRGRRRVEIKLRLDPKLTQPLSGPIEA